MENWISVKDKLPEDECDVLCYDKTLNMFIGWCNITTGIWWNYRLKIGNGVTHWMPLPAAPQEAIEVFYGKNQKTDKY